MTLPVPRIPRRVWIGKGYWIAVSLISKSKMNEILEDTSNERTDGFWLSTLGELRSNKDSSVKAGTIYIYSRLDNTEKWETYWHEMLHALVDISSFDGQTSVVT